MNERFIKKICLLFLLARLIATVDAKEKKEPVVMTVAGKDVSLSEFIFMAKQGNGVDFNNKKSVDDFVELYKILKLKVADAEALSIHEARRFEAELENLSLQLQSSYLTDKAGQDSALQVVYERTKVIPGIKRIFIRYSDETLMNSRDLDVLYDNDPRLLTRDTVALYEKALVVWQRINNGESFEEVGESLMNESDVFYNIYEYVFPLQFPKVWDECIFAMQPGDISEPVRSLRGFSLFKVDRIIPNPGTASVSHVFFSFQTKEPTDDEIEEVRKRSEMVYQKALAGEDFTELVKTFSDDSINAQHGGLIRDIGLGSIMEPIETAAFALENIGDISRPFQSDLGFHILKLVDRKSEIPFEEKVDYLFGQMRRTEYIYDLYRGFIERVKLRHGYVFYPDAYEELKRLADEYFPLDTNFVKRGMDMQKTLIRVDTFDFAQDIFVEYMYKNPRTSQIYSIDFMQDVFDDFVREILTEVERLSLERDYPEYNLTMQSYYDGTLLYELSNKRIWSRPAEEQAQLEAEWIKELNEKYPVSINKKLIKNIKKYVN